MDQLKSALKIVAKAEPHLIADKGKRDAVQHAVIAKSLQALLSAYETSLAEDEASLTAGGVSDRQRMTLVVRTGEKRLLSEAIEFMRQQDNEEAPDGQSAKRRRMV